jgi:hypothetical protein
MKKPSAIIWSFSGKQKKKKLSIHIENAPTIVKSRSTRYNELDIYVMYIVSWFNFGLWLCNEVKPKEKYIKELEYLVNIIWERIGGVKLEPI